MGCSFLGAATRKLLHVQGGEDCSSSTLRDEPAKVYVVLQVRVRILTEILNGNFLSDLGLAVSSPPISHTTLRDFFASLAR